MASLSPVLFFFLSVVTIFCVASCPFEILDNTVTSEDINTIVTKHNELRSLISNGEVPGQPKGVNLQTMEWDLALAEAAQNIANTCEYKHVNVKDERFWNVGQNLFKWTSDGDTPGAEWNGVIDAWFREHKIYKYPEAPPPKKTGHYVAIVGADSKYIGCGYTYYLNTTVEEKYQKLYVCNYGPMVNSKYPPYKTE